MDIHLSLNLGSLDGDHEEIKCRNSDSVLDIESLNKHKHSIENDPRSKSNASRDGSTKESLLSVEEEEELLTFPRGKSHRPGVNGQVKQLDIEELMEQAYGK